MSTWFGNEDTSGMSIGSERKLLTSNDPEPPIGTTVVAEGGWGRWVHDDDSTYGWSSPDDPLAGYASWTKIAGNYGPVYVEEES